MVLYPSLCVSLMRLRMIYVFLALAHLHSHRHILPFLSLVDKLCSSPAAAIPLCHQTPPLALSLSLFLLIVLNLFIALHLPPSPSFSHAAWFIHLVVFIFYPFIFLSLFLQTVFSSSPTPNWCSLWQQHYLELLDISSVSSVTEKLVSSLIYKTRCHFAVTLYIMHMIMSYHC